VEEPPSHIGKGRVSATCAGRNTLGAIDSNIEMIVEKLEYVTHIDEYSLLARVQARAQESEQYRDGKAALSSCNSINLGRRDLRIELAPRLTLIVMQPSHDVEQGIAHRTTDCLFDGPIDEEEQTLKLRPCTKELTSEETSKLRVKLATIKIVNKIVIHATERPSESRKAWIESDSRH
jgi:hypothetical protein